VNEGPDKRSPFVPQTFKRPRGQIESCQGYRCEELLYSTRYEQPQFRGAVVDAYARSNGEYDEFFREVPNAQAKVPLARDYLPRQSGHFLY
jgi:hypothetical protein